MPSDLFTLQERDCFQHVLDSSKVSGRNIALHRGVSTSGANLISDLQGGDLANMLQGLVSTTSQRDAVQSVRRKSVLQAGPRDITDKPSSTDLPRIIRFPYSRHSSYDELCQLVDLFKPRDVWPCTVNAREWCEKGESSEYLSDRLKIDKIGITVRSLFGRYCSRSVFRHDAKVASTALGQKGSPIIWTSEREASEQSNEFTVGIESSSPPELARVGAVQEEGRDQNDTRRLSQGQESQPQPLSLFAPRAQQQATALSMGSSDRAINAKINKLDSKSFHDSVEALRRKRSLKSFQQDGGEDDDEDEDGSQGSATSWTSTLSARHSLTRREAYRRTLEGIINEDTTPVQLISTGSNHSVPEKEL